MKEKFKSRKIGVTALCRISAAGGSGIYLYIPKNFADVYSLSTAEYCEVLFVKAFSKDYSEEETGPVDLTSRKKQKKAKKFE